NTTEEFEALISNLTQAVEPLSGNGKWKLAAVYAGKYGGAHRQPWEQLVALVRKVHQEAANAQETLVKYGPQLPEAADPEELLRKWARKSTERSCNIAMRWKTAWAGMSALGSRFNSSLRTSVFVGRNFLPSSPRSWERKANCCALARPFRTHSCPFWIRGTKN